MHEGDEPKMVVCLLPMVQPAKSGLRLIFQRTSRCLRKRSRWQACCGRDRRGREGHAEGATELDDTSLGWPRAISRLTALRMTAQSTDPDSSGCHRL